MTSPLHPLVDTTRKPFRLDVRHERFALLRSEGKTIKVSAEFAGISERWGKVWDDDPGVIGLVNRFTRERRNRIAAKTAVSVERWLDVGIIPFNNLVDLYKASNLKAEPPAVNVTFNIEVIQHAEILARQLTEAGIPTTADDILLAAEAVAVAAGANDL